MRTLQWQRKMSWLVIQQRHPMLGLIRYLQRMPPPSDTGAHVEQGRLHAMQSAASICDIITDAEVGWQPPNLAHEVRELIYKSNFQR